MKKYQLLLLILFIITIVLPIEVATVLTFFSLILFVNKVYRIRAWKGSKGIVLPIVLLLLLGCISGFNSINGKDYLRDIFLVVKILIFFISGVVLCSRINNISDFYKCLRTAAVIMALIHLGKIAANGFNFSLSINQFREDLGRGSTIEFIYVALFISRITSRQFNRLFLKITNIDRILFLLVFISFCLYFSRTMFINAFLIVSFLKFKLNIRNVFSKRNRSIIALVFLGFITFFSLRTIASYEAQNSFLSQFVSKLDNITNELVWTSKENTDATLADINTNWRGYEAFRGMQKYLDGSNIQKVIGFGWGSLVDLGMQQELDGKYYEEIPVLHNGYVMLLVKTGVVGLLLYLIFLFRLGFGKFDTPTISNKWGNNVGVYVSRLLSSFCIIELVSTLTVTGLLNKNDFLIVVLMGWCWGVRLFPNIGRFKLLIIEDVSKNYI
ncbi:MAG TPA: hypothetical protein VFL76_05370 [Edaphocola sp.]|nr:hypothetical protein [Edaphocola sp.]